MSDAGQRDRALGEPAAIAVSAVVGVVVALASTYFFTAWADVFYEQLFRVGPTLVFDGIGSDWFVGNTETWLNLLISLLHAADVLMGVFILLMVFIHWGAFRRLADRMRDPTHVSRQGDEVYADGGAAEGVPVETDATDSASEPDAARYGESDGDEEVSR